MTHASAATDNIAKSDFRVGSIISRSASVLLRHFPAFFIVTLIAHLPRMILLPGTQATEPMDLDQALSLLVAWSALVALIALSTLGEAVILHSAFWDIRRGPVRLAKSLNVALRRFLPIVGVAFVVVLLIRLVGGVAFVIVLSVAFVMGLSIQHEYLQKVGLIILIIPGLILRAMWFVAVAACVVERLGPWTCLRRSCELTKGHRWKLFGPVLLLNIPSFGIEFGLDAVASPIVAAIGKWIWSGFWAAFAAVVGAVAYHDLRVVKDGVVDIEQIAVVFD